MRVSALQQVCGITENDNDSAAKTTTTWTRENDRDTVVADDDDEQTRALDVSMYDINVCLSCTRRPIK